MLEVVAEGVLRPFLDRTDRPSERSHSEVRCRVGSDMIVG